ncbi:sensor histidine kinase [Marinibacterium profundimaris]|uniref:sensor histidine kinase n=1 Tax=Marinibacterium profundimaris TaxID=1679460 RepID=UPI000B52795C|nr:HAMP domain-containing sensor histidine kinase [Marinibacterium profundimaris]
MRRLARRRIAVTMGVAYGAALAALAGFAVLTFLGFHAAQVQIERAGQSLRQLETARIIEASFNRYLLDVGRRPLEEDGRDSPAAGNLRGTLLVHRGIIAEEIGHASGDAEQVQERREMVRALQMLTIFEDIERKMIFARIRQAEAGQPLNPVEVAELIALDEAAFRGILTSIIEDERAESAAALTRLEALRARYLTIGALLVGLCLLAALVIGIFAYRQLLRPIRALTGAVEDYPAAPVRAPDTLPGEFAMLANRFNSMLDRIETEQDRLRTRVEAATADLANANAELTRIDRDRRAFFANISHELRTPVTVLLGEAQVALKAGAGERAALERISANGGFLRRRLDDLLSLARSEDGTLTLGRAPFELSDAVTGAVDQARGFATASEVSLELRIAGERELIGDASALRQAVLALIDNAIKFSGPGDVITVEVTERAVSVRDQGPGFGEGDPMELFDRYVQGGSGRLRGGSGLGLAIVRWIADHHGARVEAANRAGSGAEVRLAWERPEEARLEEDTMRNSGSRPVRAGDQPCRSTPCGEGS